MFLYVLSDGNRHLPVDGLATGKGKADHGG
jgi:hypothetical protein